MYAAVDKEIHEFWTVLDTTATTKMEQMEQMLNVAATFCYPIWIKRSTLLYEKMDSNGHTYVAIL